jgi:hypothetical protein
MNLLKPQLSNLNCGAALFCLGTDSIYVNAPLRIQSFQRNFFVKITPPYNPNLMLKDIETEPKQVTVGSAYDNEHNIFPK